MKLLNQFAMLGYTGAVITSAAVAGIITYRTFTTTLFDISDPLGMKRESDRVRHNLDVQAERDYRRLTDAELDERCKAIEDGRITHQSILYPDGDESKKDWFTGVVDDVVTGVAGIVDPSDRDRQSSLCQREKKLRQDERENRRREHGIAQLDDHYDIARERNRNVIDSNSNVDGEIIPPTPDNVTNTTTPRTTERDTNIDRRSQDSRETKSQSEKEFERSNRERSRTEPIEAATEWIGHQLQNLFG